MIYLYIYLALIPFMIGFSNAGVNSGDVGQYSSESEKIAITMLASALWPITICLILGTFTYYLLEKITR